MTARLPLIMGKTGGHRPPLQLLRLVRRRPSAPTAATAPEISLQQMRQRVHVAQLAIFHAEEMRIGRAAAAICVSGAEGAEHHNRTNRRVDDKTAVGDVHPTRNAD